jgi:hypothetical protein
MKFKQHFANKELQHFNLVLLEAKRPDKTTKPNKFPPRTMEMKIYNNKRTSVGYQYYKPISKIYLFDE